MFIKKFFATLLVISLLFSFGVMGVSAIDVEDYTPSFVVVLAYGPDGENAWNAYALVDDSGQIYIVTSIDASYGDVDTYTGVSELWSSELHLLDYDEELGFCVFYADNIEGLAPLPVTNNTDFDDVEVVGFDWTKMNSDASVTDLLSSYDSTYYDDYVDDNGYEVLEILDYAPDMNWENAVLFNEDDLVIGAMISDSEGDLFRPMYLIYDRFLGDMPENSFNIVDNSNDNRDTDVEDDYDDNDDNEYEEEGFFDSIFTGVYIGSLDLGSVLIAVLIAVAVVIVLAVLMIFLFALTSRGSKQAVVTFEPAKRHELLTDSAPMGMYLRSLSGQYAGKMFGVASSVSVGTSPSCDICYTENAPADLDFTHCLIKRRENTLAIADMGATGSIYVNKQIVKAYSVTEIKPGDEFTLGQSLSFIVCDSSTPAPETADVCITVEEYAEIYTQPEVEDIIDMDISTEAELPDIDERQIEEDVLDVLTEAPVVDEMTIEDSEPVVAEDELSPRATE